MSLNRLKKEKQKEIKQYKRVLTMWLVVLISLMVLGLNGCTGYKTKAYVDIYGLSKHTRSTTPHKYKTITVNKLKPNGKPYKNKYVDKQIKIKGNPYNEMNTGIGGGILLARNDIEIGGRAATYMNSLGRRSFIVAGEVHKCGIETKFHVEMCVGGMIGGVTGYRKSDPKHIRPLIAPLVGFRKGRLKLEATVTPTADMNAAVFAAWLRIQLY